MFNIFKKKEKEKQNSPAHTDWINAKAQYEKGDFQNALANLISGFDKDVYYEPLYDLASNCLDKLGGKQESQLFKDAIRNLNSRTFKKLGNHFYGAAHYPLTRIFLEESFKEMDDLEVANNLAIAYSRRFDVKKAQLTLEKVKHKFDFWTFWFYVKMKILNNDRQEIEESLIDLKSAFDFNSQDENLKVAKQKVTELIESFERLKIVDQPEQKIRDWHFIQYGSMILNFFFSEDQYVAGGRHVASWGSNESIKSILEILSVTLKNKKIDAIAYGNTRNSQIIGSALSKLSNIESEPFASTKIYKNTLFLVSDTAEFNEYNSVDEINNNNITFSFNHDWLTSNFICPDIIGLMSQTYFFPWNGGNFKMNTDGTSSRTEPDERNFEVIANEIVSCELKENLVVDDFYTRVENYLKMNQEKGFRYNFMIESPVPGSYFGSN